MEETKAEEGDELALEVMAAVGGAALGFGTSLVTDPAGGVVVTAAATEAIRSGLRRVSGSRGRQVARMWDIAAQAAEQSHDQLLERVTADPHRRQLFWAAARAAADTALESKLQVLGQLLADGVIHEEHEVDEARLLLPAIEPIERAHLRVLDCLSNSYLTRLTEEEQAKARAAQQPDAWPFDLLAEEVGASRSALELTIGTLSGDNLIRGSADSFDTPSAPQMHWRLTDPGWAVLERFRTAGEAAAGPKAAGEGSAGPRGD